MHIYSRRRRYGNRRTGNRRRRRPYARRGFRHAIRRRYGRFNRRHAGLKYKFFHVRFHRVLTTDWPAASKVPKMVDADDNDPTKETPLLWNMDHLQFKLSQFIQCYQPPNFTFQHQPPFRYYKINKVVVKGTWINFPERTMENTLGNTALDLDGEDTGRGNVTQSNLDPGKPPTMGDPPTPVQPPYIYDPLQNRASKKAFNMLSGFKRIFRPKPSLTETGSGSKVVHWFNKPTPWVSVREGCDLPWNGLSITLRQMKDPLNEDPEPPIPQIQYDISMYVTFREFDYETGKQLVE
nr:MAG: putative capsid protein [Canine circovirus]